MSQCCCKVTLELLSDTIFGSGFSIPGGEDIAVNVDSDGYPYLKGSTLKGLLRESLQDWMIWENNGGTVKNTINALLGEDGWTGSASERRIRLTGLTLEAAPIESEACFSLRTFTSMENGVVKDKTLRSASCVKSGLIFCGHLYCDENDFDLLENAVSCIKWVGTMRNRGFGHVKASLEKESREVKKWGIKKATCLFYTLRTDTPVLITDLSSSQQNTYRSRNYITGSSVRGAIMTRLAEKDPIWFEENKTKLLSDEVRFLDAYPIIDNTPIALPTFKGFYENKDESGFESVVVTGSFEAGKKRAKMGSFCSLCGNQIRVWNGQNGYSTRIRKGNTVAEKEIFQTQHISEGQTLVGYIVLDNDQYAEHISDALGDTIWLGSDQYEGFGKCTVLSCEAVENPKWWEYAAVSENSGSELYMVAVSPVSMIDDKGDPCGLNISELSRLLGVKAEIMHCSTSMVEVEGYNRTWESRLPIVRMYDAGSVFHLRFDSAPDSIHIQKLQRTGIGIRRESGFGQVLFLSKDRFESITEKVKYEPPKGSTQQFAAECRRKKLLWVMNNVMELKKTGVSGSQLGELQSICETSSNSEQIKGYIKQRKGVGRQNSRSNFAALSDFVDSVLNNPIGKTISFENAPDSIEERIGLLCMCINHSRKEKR